MKYEQIRKYMGKIGKFGRYQRFEVQAYRPDVSPYFSEQDFVV